MKFILFFAFYVISIRGNSQNGFEYNKIIGNSNIGLGQKIQNSDIKFVSDSTLDDIKNKMRPVKITYVLNTEVYNELLNGKEIYINVDSANNISAIIFTYLPSREADNYFEQHLGKGHIETSMQGLSKQPTKYWRKDQFCVILLPLYNSEFIFIAYTCNFRDILDSQLDTLSKN